MANRFDVAIVGAGTVGLALANSLRQTLRPDFRIALIESRDLLTSPKSFSRYVSLTPSSTDFLDSLLKPASTPGHTYNCISVLDSRHRAEVDFAGGTRARIVHVGSLDAALLESLSSNTDSHIEFFNKTKISSVSGLSDTFNWPEITLENEDTPDNGAQISCRLIIGADGANSLVSKAAGIPFDGFQYGKRGVVASLSTSSNPGMGDRAYQRFLQDGPIALLPTSESTFSLVWTLPATIAEQLEKLDESTFVRLINAALRCDQPDISYLLNNIASIAAAKELETELEFSQSRAKFSPDRPLPVVDGVIDASSTRGSFPLRAGTSRYYLENRCVLVGDAAHTIHPLAGQGLNLGLGDVKCLAHVIIDAASKGEDFGMDPSFVNICA
ncbi:MAG: hypothetical protein SGCHY_002667 [Lobulomycetales sp.]